MNITIINNIKRFFFSSVFILAAAFCCAEELIYDFDVTFKLNEYGGAEVTEEITINAEHKKINRGIYRSIPNKSDYHIKAKSLEMDGIKHPYLANFSDGYKIAFGDDNLIHVGKHKYKLIYTIDNIVNHNINYDELYWNVTGNDWDFKINNASFTLIPPEGLEIIESGISLYTGKYGKKEHNAAAIKNLKFKTTAPLDKHEGFTVAIPFKKGLIKESLSHKILRFLPYILLAALALYCLITWFVYGKDPKYDGRVLFAPPEGLSPAMAGFILKRKTDLKLFTAALVSLATKKAIEITTIGKEVEINPNSSEDIALSAEEIVLKNSFKKVVILDGETNYTLKLAYEKFEKSLEQQGKKLIKTNRLFIIIPILLLASIAAVFIYKDLDFLFCLAVPVALLSKLSFFFRNKYAFYISLMLCAALMYFLTQDYIIIASLLIIAVYYRTIDNASSKGKETYLEVLGFKKYMDTAEKHRAENSNPEDELKIFADYLPYAYAFGIEGKWIKKFQKILSKEVLEEACWPYGGGALLSGTLSSSVAKSGASFSGRSGSFGGGFSGGGHGGGGGGGR